jgi:uncharacterized phage protein (TIGR01671 family)
MNRIIKFRAWDKTNKRMMIFDNYWPCDEYQSLAWCINEESKTENEGDYCLDWDAKNIEIMQYTGLLDKNGKEIYEGDIVKNSNCEDRIYEVKWTNNFYSAGSGLVLTDTSKYGVEILGNIYGNPELLEAK